MKSKELWVELRNRIVPSHRSGEGYQNRTIEDPKNTMMVAIIFKWKEFGTIVVELAARPN
jgi:hypothetical protein